MASIWKTGAPVASVMPAGTLEDTTIKIDITNLDLSEIKRIVATVWILEPILFRVLSEKNALRHEGECLRIRSHSPVARRDDFLFSGLPDHITIPDCLPEDLPRLDIERLAVLFAATSIQQLQGLLNGPFNGGSLDFLAVVIRESVDENRYTLELQHLALDVDMSVFLAFEQLCQAMHDVARLSASEFKDKMQALHSLALIPVRGAPGVMKGLALENSSVTFWATPA